MRIVCETSLSSGDVFNALISLGKAEISTMEDFNPLYIEPIFYNTKRPGLL